MSGFMEYRVRFTRYEPGHKRLISRPINFHAENFTAAVQKAGLILDGMRYATPDPDNTVQYAIVSIKNTGYHGKEAGNDTFLRDPFGLVSGGEDET